MLISIAKKTLHMILALLAIMGVPLAIKQFLLRPVRYRLMGDSIAGQVFQWGTSFLLIITCYILFARIFEKRKTEELALKKVIPHSIQGGLWGFFSITLILGILAITGNFEVLGWNGEAGAFQMILMLFLLSATEEIIYRGIMYRLLEKWAGTIPALITTSLLFSILHINNENYNIFSFLAILSGGLLMGLMFSLSRSLWWPVAAHFWWNCTQVILGIRLSGTDLFSGQAILESRLKGNPLMTGGEFGMENSVVTIVYTTAMALFLLIRLLKKKPARH